MATKRDLDHLNTFVGAPDASIDTVSQDEALRLKDVAELEAFMNERVLVQVPRDTNPEAPPVVILSVNGRNQVVPRGNTPVFMRRMYLEVLARMKQSNFSQEVQEGVEKRIITHEHEALVYPFNVLLDPNPKGPAWLMRVMESAS